MVVQMFSLYYECYEIINHFISHLIRMTLMIIVVSDAIEKVNFLTIKSITTPKVCNVNDFYLYLQISLHLANYQIFLINLLF